MVYLAGVVVEELERLGGKGGKGGEGGGMIVAGYSSGAAMMGVLMLSGEVERLVSIRAYNTKVQGWMGISGYLPFRREVLAAVQYLPVSDLQDRRRAARNFIRKLLDLEPWDGGEEEEEDGGGWERMKVWLGHGESDQKVQTRLGEEWRDLLGTELGLDVRWKGYKGLGHGLGGGEGLVDVICDGMDGLGFGNLVDREGGKNVSSKL